MNRLVIMDAPELSIPLLLGTNRKDRQSENVARWVRSKMLERPEIETKFFDVRDFALPQDGYGPEIVSLFPEWRDAVIAADGLVLVVPEYNHSFPGVLKSVLDLCLKEYIHKAVAIVGVSAGPFGGTRVIESLLPVVRELGLTVTFTDLHFPRVCSLFDDEGNMIDSAFEKRVTSFLDELIWMATALRWGRNGSG